MKLFSTLFSLLSLQTIWYGGLGQQQMNNHCYSQSSINNILLCKTFQCPDGYHICNNYDVDTLKQIDTSKIQGMYITNIAYSNSNKNTDEYTCNLCSFDETKYQDIEPTKYDEYEAYLSQRKMLTLYNPNEQNQDIQQEDETLCSINNQWIPQGTGSFINQCLFCICQDGKRDIHSQTRCINICHSSRITYQEYKDFLTTKSIMDTASREKYDCLGRSVNPTIERNTMFPCNVRNREIMTGATCCRNQQCKSPYCNSCVYNNQKYNNEVCLMCGNTDTGEQTYLMKMYANPRCMTKRQIENVCNYHYMLDMNLQNAYCLECEHGDINSWFISNDTRIHGRCECKEGYFGEKCQYSYDVLFCNGNGKYNVERKECVCNRKYQGEDCSLYIEASLQCVNGIYDKNRLQCICKNGWMGRVCDIQIPCVRGYIENQQCICEPNFSGDDCSKFRRGAVVETSSFISYNENDCKNGLWRFETQECNCFKDYTGLSCDIKKCKFGSYDLDTKRCICNKGYMGEQCEKSCSQECNYNGNNCNPENECICENGWTGEKCQTIQLKHLERNNVVRVEGLLIDMKFQTAIVGTDTTNVTTIIPPLQIDIKSCFEPTCVPFTIDFDTLNIFQEVTTNGRIVTSRFLQQIQQEYTLITLNNDYIDIEKEYFMVIPNGNINQSYPVYSNTLFLDNQYSRFEFAIYSKQDNIFMEETNIKGKTDIIQTIAEDLDIPMSSGNIEGNSNQDTTSNTNAQQVSGSFWNDVWNGIEDVVSIPFIQYFGGVIGVLFLGLLIRKMVKYIRNGHSSNFHLRNLLNSSQRWRESHRTTEEIEIPSTIQKENSNESVTTLSREIYTSKRQSIVVTENKTTDIIQKQIDVLEQQKTKEMEKQQESLSYYRNPITVSNRDIQQTLRRNSHTKIYSAPKRNSIRLGNIQPNNDRKTPTSFITDQTNPANDTSSNSIVSYGKHSGGSESIHGSCEEIV